MHDATPPGKADAILDAAEALFARHGFDAVSVNEVARQAGVSKANVFHHFHSKESLYAAVLARARRVYSDQVAAAAGRPLAPREQLIALVNAHAATLRERPGLARLFLREMLQPHTPERLVQLLPLFQENFSNVVGLLRRAQERGETRGDFDPALAVTLLLAADVFLFQFEALLTNYPEVGFAARPEGLGSAVVELLWRGLHPEP